MSAGDIETSVAQMALKLDEIRALHERALDDRLGVDCCFHCWDCFNDTPTPWPCETMRIVERVAL